MDLTKYIESLNWPIIIGMFAIIWYFTQEMKAAVIQQGIRIDNLYKMYAETQKEIKDIYVILMNQKDKKDE